MGFDIVKFFSGFAFWKGQVIGKILYYLIIVIVALFVFWKLFVAPTNKTTQKAENITNITQTKSESALELQIIPPKVKIGGLKIQLFKEK